MKYKYKFGDQVIETSRKLYKQDGVYLHKKGDFFEPVSPNLMFKISIALLSTMNGWFKNESK